MMQRFEFKVVPAPRRGEKARGIKTTEERFAYSLTQVLNEMARDGWDYVRADALPCDERVGLTGSKTSFQNMLVFRRVLEADAAHPVGRLTAIDLVPAVGPTQVVPAQAGPRIGSAEPPSGPAPALGPAKGGVAAE
jgi:hypothetical protein